MTASSAPGQQGPVYKADNPDIAGGQMGIAGFSFADLYHPRRLRDLNTVFEYHLHQAHPELYQQFHEYQRGVPLTPPQISTLLVAMASEVGQFIAELFQVQEERCQQISATQESNRLIFGFRKEFIKPALNSSTRYPVPENPVQVQHRIDALLIWYTLQLDNLCDEPRELEVKTCKFAFWLRQLPRQTAELPYRLSDLYEVLEDAEELDWRHSLQQLQEKEGPEAVCTALLDFLGEWIRRAAPGGPLSERTRDWFCFRKPARVDSTALVPHREKQYPGYSAWLAPDGAWRARDGFALTDKRYSGQAVQYEVDYCIYCHERDTDSCSKGMRRKKRSGYVENASGVAVTGCPLEEKISEMHLLKKQGDNIAALALIIVDNPMCPGTGHRICNDCMKACIYQKTEPVNIPQIETNILTDVLFMSWGFEIYSLLTRWNPLNIRRPYALPYNGKRVLIAGMGPAGYTLAHYLLNEGFAATGIDALKIEPLPAALTGADGQELRPIRDFKVHYEALDKRVMNGFGGVAEYGITARWDKNFLKVIYLNLLRRKNFRCYGGVRFGGTLTIEDAWELGFDHIAMATGAGKPTIIGLQNNLIRGIRKASDFLMSLQLTGASKENSLANLQIRLPAAIIGGGLTALDTSTEVMAYYPMQVEKVLRRYELLVREHGVEHVRRQYDQEELATLDEFIRHGKMVRRERKRAMQEGREPNFRRLVDRWGGVTLFYRKGIEQSPAYRQNHEEVCRALEEGIRLAPGMVPGTAIADECGALRAVTFSRLQCDEQGDWTDTGEQVEIPMRSLFIAAGTAPNTIYEQEHPYSLRMAGRFFQRYEPSWQEGADLPELVPMSDIAAPKLGRPAPFSSWQKGGKFITFYGDNHPVYAGNVVRAMASARDGYPYICRLFASDLARLSPDHQEQRDRSLENFYRRLDARLLATIKEVKRLTPTIIEIIVQAPMQAEKFQPGQFYRVQNLEIHAPVIEDTVLAAEGLALTGAWVDKQAGLISLITLEMGSSSRLCALWKVGDQINLMGVTGTATEIPSASTVMLVGGGLGNAVLLSVGRALRAANNRVLYFAGYRKADDRFKPEAVEEAADVVVWCVDPGEDVQPLSCNRRQDKSHVGNVIEGMEAYARGQLGATDIDLGQVGHIIAIGSDRMMAAVKDARHGRLQPWLQPDHTAIGSINSPMQCMMKGVCAQCLCRHVSPDTGEEYFVYSCYQQDQELDRVDFDHLNGRLRQNSVLEKLSNLWLDRLLARASST